MSEPRRPLPVDERLVPAPDDTALFHELRRRLAADVLAGAERGDMGIALDTLRHLAQHGASDKVRGKAAADLARVLAATATARHHAHVQVGAVQVVTAADLLAGVDPAALRAATAALLAGGAPGPRTYEAGVAAPPGPALGGGAGAMGCPDSPPPAGVGPGPGGAPGPLGGSDQPLGPGRQATPIQAAPAEPANHGGAAQAPPQDAPW